jgi:hypothetical protein
LYVGDQSPKGACEAKGTAKFISFFIVGSETGAGVEVGWEGTGVGRTSTGAVEVAIGCISESAIAGGKVGFGMNICLTELRYI